MSAPRSTREVLDDHLRVAQECHLETDLERNFSDEVVLLTSYGVFRGIEGVWEAFRLFDRRSWRVVTYIRRRKSDSRNRSVDLRLEPGKHLLH